MNVPRFDPKKSSLALLEAEIPSRGVRWTLVVVVTVVVVVMVGGGQGSEKLASSPSRSRLAVLESLQSKK